MKKSFAILLCGGSGTRLWPLSRALRPKQLLALHGELTLLQQTAKRLSCYVDPKNIVTVTHQDHRFEVMGQLGAVLPDAINGVIAEPVARNTLPAIAFAVKKIYELCPNAVIGVFPSDHVVGNNDAFFSAWESAEIAAESGYLSLLGIKPTEPATGYGYIQPSSRHATDPSADKLLSAFQVTRFVEKPDIFKAKQFLDEGYLWNSGMFVFKADTFNYLLKIHQPELYTQLDGITSETINDKYKDLPNLSIDYGLAEKAEKIAVVPVDMAWSDLGSWDSIYHKNVKDADGNVAVGEVVNLDTKDSLIWNTHGLIATLGVSNLIVVQTADATLICDRSRAEDVKKLVTRVQSVKPKLAELHLTVHRPWGTYTVLEEAENFKIKRISVNPGAKLSMQMHHHRSEHWVVVSGTATVTNGDQVLELSENESTYIPKGHRHRLENRTDITLYIIEVQCGEYVGEDDIVRFEDSYGRSIA